MISLLDFLFPKKCLICGSLGRYFCLSCLEKLSYTKNQICPGCYNPSFSGKTHPFCQEKTALDGLAFGFSYQGLIKTAIKKIKYREIFSLTEELVELAIKRIQSSMFSHYLIIPIPLHIKRFSTRGFNQSELIGEIISKNWNLSIEKKVLQRIKNTQSQVKLKKKERAENIKGAFSVINKEEIAGQKILLIDDVFTSGATLNEAAKILKKEGVVKVWALTIAHGH